MACVGSVIGDPIAAPATRPGSKARIWEEYHATPRGARAVGRLKASGRKLYRGPFGTRNQRGSVRSNTKTDMAKKAETQTAAKRILLVDDDAEIIESLRLALEAQDYQVLVARDGNQGLALIERENPDLIILDMMMPKRSGFLVLERLKRLGDKKHRIIMITANEGNRHKAYAEMLGVDDYVRKPFPMDRLIQSVKRLLGE